MRRLPTALAAMVVIGVLAAGVPSPAAAVLDPPELITADAETVPVSHSGDAADDPAIWVDPADAARSLVIGNDKGGALETYNLDGSLQQRITTATTVWGNVDVAQNITIGGQTRDVVAAYNGGLRLYAMNQATRMLEQITDGTGTIASPNGGGLCLYDSPMSHDLSAFVITAGGKVQQFRVDDADSDGLLDATVVRSFAVGSAAEGCVADESTGALYVSQQDVALWRYGAEPTDGPSRTAVDQVQPAGHLSADIEGVTLVRLADGSGYLIASAQNHADPTHSYFVVYDRQTNAYVKSFRIVSGAGADGCERTDGVAAYAGSLGQAFPSGLFVCQDNSNRSPGAGNQDFKLVRLEKVVDLDGGVDPVPGEVTFVGATSANVNKATHPARIPASVRAGDALLLFLTANKSTATITGPTGWTLLRDATISGETGRLWQRVALTTDAGSTVTVRTSQTTKADVTVAAYRGTGAVGASASAIDARTRSTHVTPTVTVSRDGSWLISYWADKSAAGSAWSLPTGQTARSASTGTGSGHITAALADSGAAVSVGTAGGLTAASSVASRAVMFSVVLTAAG